MDLKRMTLYDVRGLLIGPNWIFFVLAKHESKKKWYFSDQKIDQQRGK